MPKTVSKPQTRTAKRQGRNANPGGGKSDGELVRISNRWRDAYNPLRGLVIAKVVALIEAGERGDYAELQWLNRKVEKRYPILKGLRTRWDSAIEEMDWDIKKLDKLPPGATEAMADEQVKYLRSRYELVENLTEAFGFLALADFRGFSILQKHRIHGGPNDGAVRELHWLPQWNFCRDGMFGDFYYNQEFIFGASPELLGEQNRIGGDSLPREEFIIREVDAPIYEIALIAFTNWAMGRKDWAAFVEIFGLAKGVAIMPPGIPQGKEEEYRIAAEKVSDGVAGALPHGSDMKFPTAGVRGEAPFKQFCEAQDADVVMAGTGGRLTMLTAEKGGLGDGPSQEQDEAFKKVGRAVARKINQVLQRDFDKLELEAAFPGQPVLAYFELAAVEEEDAQAVMDVAVKANGIGLQPDAEEISSKVDLKLTRVESPDPNFDLPDARPALKLRNRTAAMAAELGVPTSWLQPISDLFAELETAAAQPGFTRADAVRLLEAAILRLPELFGRMDIDSLADVFSAGMGAASVAGLRAALASKILNYDPSQSRDEFGRWVDENGGGLSEHDNIQRGQRVLDYVTKNQRDVQRGMYRKEVGQIAFEWGRPGHTTPDAQGRTHTDGYGLSHIQAKHPNDLRRLPVAIAKGRIVPHDVDPENKKFVIHENLLVVMRRTGKHKAYVVTGFEAPEKINELEKKTRPAWLTGK